MMKMEGVKSVLDQLEHAECDARELSVEMPGVVRGRILTG
jgi:hypothetical protein